MVDTLPKPPVRWYRSVAVRSFGIAFVSTHVPLLALIALIALAPGWLSPWGVLGVTLMATLGATALVLVVLWRLFRPLRQAVDGLRDYMLSGKPLRTKPQRDDEIGRLVGVLAHALAHIDRGRAPLLQAGAIALQGRTGISGAPEGVAPRTLCLLEVDQWQLLDEETTLQDMMAVQATMHGILNKMISTDEVLLPWGRGRYLLVLQEAGSGVEGRLWPLLRGFSSGASDIKYTCSVAIEPHGGAGGWSAALQRLDYKLFALRSEGRTACVV